MTVEEKYKAIKKKLSMSSDEEIATMFGYKNVASFRSSKGGRERLIIGIVAFFEKVGEELNKQHNDFFDLLE